MNTLRTLPFFLFLFLRSFSFLVNILSVQIKLTPLSALPFAHPKSSGSQHFCWLPHSNLELKYKTHRCNLVFHTMNDNLSLCAIKSRKIQEVLRSNWCLGHTYGRTQTHTDTLVYCTYINTRTTIIEDYQLPISKRTTTTTTTQTIRTIFRKHSFTATIPLYSFLWLLPATSFRILSPCIQFSCWTESF